MAATTCKTVAGIVSSAQPFKLRSTTGATVLGVESYAGSVTWNGSSSARTRVDWIPGAHVPVLDASGRMSPPWYRFMQEMANNRLGGLGGKTVPEIEATTTKVQKQVISAQTIAIQANNNVAKVADTVNTVRDVAVQNNLPGSTQIQRLPSYKLDQIGSEDDF